MRNRLLLTLCATSAIAASMSISAGASTTPYAQMKTVIADITSKESARVTATLTKSGNRLVNTTDATRFGGWQTIVLTDAGKSNTVVIELVSGGLYVKGDAAILMSYMGLSKATSKQLSNQWFSIPKDNAEYAEASQGLTLSSIATELTMNKSVSTLRSSAPVYGVKVNVVKGTSVKSALEPSSVETMYFTTSAHPVPVLAKQTYQGSTSTIVFSHWNETVALSVPEVKFQLN
jgi:hypothetical protein